MVEGYTLLNEKEFYEEVKPKAPRSNCVLNNDKLLNTGFKIRNSRNALIESIKQLKWRQQFLPMVVLIFCIECM